MRKRCRLSKRKLFSLIVPLICILITVLVYSGSRIFDYINQKTSSNAVSEDSDFVRFIDVGQGDCALIYSNGKSALIDTGTVVSSNDVCKELKDIGIKDIDVMMISHLHSDHTGGIERITEDFKVKNLILPELSTFSEGMSAAQNAINSVTSSGGGVYNAVQGMNFDVGNFEITVLAAYSDDEENNRSIFAMAQIEGRKFLFTGDAETEVEKRLIEEGLNLECDVLKVGHHGSNTSSSKVFLDKVKPKNAVISVGIDNSYGHPHNEVINRFKSMNTEIFRTDKSGSLTFYVKDGKISVKTEK
ncbi:MAG: MBL fold metallo-hydrolase [Clostridia bacterium]|nr:MBL fold metallo-hydrolase [Clostridia bacterium]